MSKKFYRRFIRVNGQLETSPRFNKKKDADELYEQMRRKKQFIRDGFVMPDDPDAVTVFQYASNWVQRRFQNYPKATAQADAQRIRDYFLPNHSELPLGSITPGQIKAALNAVTDSGKSVETRNRVKAVLSRMFKDALSEEIIRLNPVSGVEFSDRRRGKKKPSYLGTTEDCKKFLDVAGELSLQHLVIVSLGLMAGLRKSEMLALKWGRIDFQNSTINICEKVEQVSLEVKSGTKKGEFENRLVPVPKELINTLSKYRKTVKYSGNNDFVLTQVYSDRFMNPGTLYARVEDVSRLSALKVSVHGLRHSYGREFAARSGNLKALQAILGHSSSQTTDRYSDLAGDRIKEFGEVVSFEKKSTK